MTEPTILPIKKGTLSQRNKTDLRKAGIIVIECNNPWDIRLINPMAEISGGDLFRCALEALNSDKSYASDQQRQHFTKLVFEAIKGNVK